VVWTWSASDHFEAKDVCTSPQTAAASDGVAPGGAATYDVFHCESIDIDPANGNLLVAARHMNSVFYIDKADTQKVLWKMGGKNSSKDNATFITVADPFDQQHDARLVAGWSSTCHGGTGQVSMFDDETTSGEVARGVVYDVVVGGSGSACPDGGAFDGGAPAPGTAINAWQYQGIHPSAGTGSMRISPDNTRIIGWGIFVGPVFTEVDVAKHKLREFSFASLDDSYRAIKVPLDTFDLPTLRMNAGK
jgi:hypothetical protein